MDVNEHESFSLRHKLLLRNSTFIAVLHFTLTVGSSIMIITHTRKCEMTLSLQFSDTLFASIKMKIILKYFHKALSISSTWQQKIPVSNSPANYLIDWCSTLTVFQLHCVYHGPCMLSTSPAIVEVYSIPHHVIKFVSDLQQVCGFLSQ